MLCSGRELGLTDDHEGILIVRGLDGSAVVEARPPGAGLPLVDALGIEADVVFDIAVEANRPDAWCMAGIARDLAAALRLPFSIPEPRAPTEVGAAGGNAGHGGGGRRRSVSALHGPHASRPDRRAVAGSGWPVG